MFGLKKNIPLCKVEKFRKLFAINYFIYFFDCCYIFYVEQKEPRSCLFINISNQF